MKTSPPFLLFPLVVLCLLLVLLGVREQPEAAGPVEPKSQPVAVRLDPVAPELPAAPAWPPAAPAQLTLPPGCGQ